MIAVVYHLSPAHPLLHRQSPPAHLATHRQHPTQTSPSLIASPQPPALLLHVSLHPLQPSLLHPLFKSNPSYNCCWQSAAVAQVPTGSWDVPKLTVSLLYTQWKAPLSKLLNAPSAPTSLTFDAATPGFTYDTLAGLDHLQCAHTEAFSMPSLPPPPLLLRHNLPRRIHLSFL
jgi:hypothetical protein